MQTLIFKYDDQGYTFIELQDVVVHLCSGI